MHITGLALCWTLTLGLGSLLDPYLGSRLSAGPFSLGAELDIIRRFSTKYLCDSDLVGCVFTPTLPLLIRGPAINIEDALLRYSPLESFIPLKIYEGLI
jgi:hypothetical protein